MVKQFEMDYQKAANYWIEKDKNSKHMEREALLSHIEDFLKEHNTCALATGFGDFVRCTPIEYHYIQGAFYIFSEGGQKFLALSKNKNVSLAVFDHYEGFGKLGGLQVMGVAEILKPFGEEYNKFLDYKKLSKEAMKKLPTPIHLIKIVPKEMDYLNAKLKNLGYDARQHIKFDS